MLLTDTCSPRHLAILTPPVHSREDCQGRQGPESSLKEKSNTTRSQTQREVTPEKYRTVTLYDLDIHPLDPQNCYPGTLGAGVTQNYHTGVTRAYYTARVTPGILQKVKKGDFFRNGYISSKSSNMRFHCLFMIGIS